MVNISSVRLSVPKASAGEILRKDLIAAVLDSPKKLIYIHAGAGYGKTTLLSQVANSTEGVVWVTLDGENDVYAFLNILSEAFRQNFTDFEFNPTEYLPFEKSGNFITILANAFISCIEKYRKALMIILDDLHTLEGRQVRELIACILKYKPENIRFCLSSREAPWQELVPFRVRGSILELSRGELAFTGDEILQILGFEDQAIFKITEGWPLAVGSFKVLLENGVPIADVISHGNQDLYAYLFYECISRLSSEMVDFLKSSACFEELEPQMLDTILDKKNTKFLLEDLVGRNIFTIKTSGGHYRYHPLFREYLLECTGGTQTALLQTKAAGYCFDKKQYSKAAEYAMRLENKDMLEQVILISYRDYIKSGRFSELRTWFQALGDASGGMNRELLIARGAFLSSIGNFTEAKTCLDTAIPRINQDEKELYFEAMVHKARVLRNFISFEESNKLLDELIPGLEEPSSEQSYSVVIEKIYNLCWNSQVNEALALAAHMVETCAKAGNVRVKAWYERYLSVIYYVAGRMKDSVYYYEKSLDIPEGELQYLDMHSIDIYVAKSYQMLGERDKAISLVTAEIQRLRSTGRYEELWLGYLFAAEIHYQNTSIDRMNGSSQTFEKTIKYFTLADEYAPLYRKSEFQMDWAKLQSNIYGLMFINGNKEKIINEIYEDIPHVGDHFKTIAFGRLFNYFGSISDFSSAKECAKRSIEIGEQANTMMVATMAYGFLARIALDSRNYKEAGSLIKRFLQLCHENGIYEYFRMRKAYDPILEFALDRGIEPGITKQMMDFAGYKVKKAYIAALGGFSVFPYKDKRQPVKLRSKKERELFAYLLDAGRPGVTKEQMYEALWYESDSEDVKKLIGVYLAHIKKDLDGLGILNPIVNNKKHYSICRDEIETDVELFEAAAREFRQQSCFETAQRILHLYKGEYLAGFEAHWAVGQRISYAEIYEEAFEFCKKSGSFQELD